MVHGYMDSAATFIPLVETLPDTYYYVAFDMPGHGKSDPFPKGHLVSTAEQVQVVRQIVDSMKWETFVLITHSVAFFVGVIYNCVYPNRVTKMINLDPGPPMSTYCFNDYNMPLWFQYVYNDYYEDYDRWHQEWPRQYTYDEVINTVMRNRKLSRENAAIVLSRVLVPQANGKYGLSWVPSSKKLTGVPMSEDNLLGLVSKNPPPMLNVLASEDDTLEMFKKNGRRLLKKFQDNLPNYTVLNVTGTHDVHIANPESFAKDIVEFLNKDFGKIRSKL
ncbi:serine hydrolase-like protein isoform X2 [Epargyreus clarus]